MAFGQEDPSKTEKATPKRRKQARKKGNVPKSAEMGKVMTLLAGIIALRFLMPYIYERLMKVYRWSFKDSLGLEIDKQKAYELFVWGIQEMAFIVMPVLLIIAVMAYITMRLQVGSLWTTQVFRPKFAQMFNLTKGIKKLLISPQAFIRLGRSVGQAFAVGVAPVIILMQEYPKLPTLFDMTPGGIAAYILSIGYKMACYALVPMMIIAILDLVYTRWNYEEQLKMTKDETKDERKQAEGDPKIKAAQRQKMMQTMARRMMGKRAQGRCRHHQPCTSGPGPELQPFTGSRPSSAGQGSRGSGRTHQGNRPTKQHSHPGRQATGTGFV